MHVLPRVRELHERFADVLTVVGVHSGKFVTERRTERIAEACDRLDVTHPVVNDRQFRVWRDYAVMAWPTLVLVDAEGRIAMVAPGETPVEMLAGEIEKAAEAGRNRGTLAAGPDPYLATLGRHEGPLRFPTRAVLSGDRLWISDTGHGRVLECEWDPGAGAATVVSEHGGFEEPRGLAALGDALYVADRRGQAVWRLDAGGRSLVAGTGRLADRAVEAGSAAGTALRSPWGLARAGSTLVVTMAGSHQLWLLDPAADRLALLAGTGREEIFDGPPATAALAQPTGVAVSAEGTTAFADCESSAVRVLEAASVLTLVGTDLFKFGDRAGVGEEALLQHCEDVAVHGDVLAVADTYNDRLKLVDPATRECVPWPGEAGQEGALREPAGMWSDGSTLLACDTGNHRIVALDDAGTLRDVSLV